MKKRSKLSGDTVILPRGTRVLLRCAVTTEDGTAYPEGTVAVVREVAYNSYRLETPGGQSFKAERCQLTPERHDLLIRLGARQWEYRQLVDQAILATVVGSRAWGLFDEHSDEDVRGVYVAPFDTFAGLWDIPGEIRDPHGDTAYWEIEKFIHQGLRGDANTLEFLWAPQRKLITPLGERLLEQREMFVSRHVIGSFGRYAIGQFHKIERTLVRDAAQAALIEAITAGAVSGGSAALECLVKLLAERGERASLKDARGALHNVCQSLCDRGLLGSSEYSALELEVRTTGGADLIPQPYRPKNAYNLLRLLYSCLNWLAVGEPLITVTGDMKARLMAIKTGAVPIEDVLLDSRALSAEIDAQSSACTLPEDPDFNAADELLRLARRQSAAKTFYPGDAGAPDLVADPPGATHNLARSCVRLADPTLFEILPVPLPLDLDVSALKAFINHYLYGPYLNGHELDGAQTDACRNHQDDKRPDVRLDLLWVALTGAHAYGFPSPDSDVDLKAVYRAPVEAFLGLSAAPTPVDYLNDWRGREFDFTAHELGQTARLILRGNGNLIERFLGPYPVLTSPQGWQFAKLVEDSLSQRSAAHYRGFFNGVLREYEREAARGERKAKRLLYGYRVALTGCHLLLSGKLETNVRALADEYNYPRVSELIAIKEAGEWASIPAGEDGGYLADMGGLETQLDAALCASILPLDPPNAHEIERFVIAARRHAGDNIGGSS